MMYPIRHRRIAPVFLGVLLGLLFLPAAAIAVPCGERCTPPPPPPSAPATTTVAAHLTYADSNVQRPISFARVEVWRYAPRALGIWTWGNDATLVTNANGDIAKSFSYSYSGVVYALRVFPENRGGRVVSPGGVYFEPGYPAGPLHRTATTKGQVLRFDANFTGQAAQAFNLVETARVGYEFVAARRDPAETDTLPTVSFTLGSITGGPWYNPLVDTVEMVPDYAFDDAAVLHEYGHFVEEQISSFVWIASSHDGCNYKGAQHAWMEGFSDWFAAAVVSSSPGANLHAQYRGTPSPTRLENPYCSAPAGAPDELEAFVSAALWDMTDAANEGSDVATVASGDVLRILDRELDVYGKGPTIHHFRDAWRSRGWNMATLDSVWANNGIPTP
jgi:hypothetical protein